MFFFIPDHNIEEFTTLTEIEFTNVLELYTPYSCYKSCKVPISTTKTITQEIFIASLYYSSYISTRILHEIFQIGRTHIKDYNARYYTIMYQLKLYGIDYIKRKRQIYNWEQIFKLCQEYNLLRTEKFSEGKKLYIEIKNKEIDDYYQYKYKALKLYRYLEKRLIVEFQICNIELEFSNLLINIIPILLNLLEMFGFIKKYVWREKDPHFSVISYKYIVLRKYKPISHLSDEDIKSSIVVISEDTKYSYKRISFIPNRNIQYLTGLSNKEFEDIITDIKKLSISGHYTCRQRLFILSFYYNSNFNKEGIAAIFNASRGIFRRNIKIDKALKAKKEFKKKKFYSSYQEAIDILKKYGVVQLHTISIDKKKCPFELPYENHIKITTLTNKNFNIILDILKNRSQSFKKQQGFAIEQKLILCYIYISSNINKNNMEQIFSIDSHTLDYWLQTIKRYVDINQYRLQHSLIFYNFYDVEKYYKKYKIKFQLSKDLLNKKLGKNKTKKY